MKHITLRSCEENGYNRVSDTLHLWCIFEKCHNKTLSKKDIAL